MFQLTEEEFEFITKKDDLEYWLKIKFTVLLVVYFSKRDELYAKKIDGLDIESAKKKLPIVFCKKKDQLKEGVNILEKYSHSFRSRINYAVEEKLFSNIFEFRILPKYLFIYDSKISTKKEIFERIDPMECPIFALYGKKIYSFVPSTVFSKFHELAIESDEEDKKYFSYFLKDQESKRIGIELINLIFRDFCQRRKIGFNKKFGRYYFQRDDIYQEILKVQYKSHKGRKSERTVVKHCVYGKDKFFRHFAFEIDYFNIDQNLYLTINPKYLLTLDGENPMEDEEKIHKYVQYKISREMNQHVKNHIYFLFNYLADGSHQISLSNYGNEKVVLSKNKMFKASFGIAGDFKDYRREEKIGKQRSLFE